MTIKGHKLFEVATIHAVVGVFYSDGSATWTIGGAWEWRWNGTLIEDAVDDDVNDWSEWGPAFGVVTAAYIEYINKLTIGDV